MKSMFELTIYTDCKLSTCIYNIKSVKHYLKLQKFRILILLYFVACKCWGVSKVSLVKIFRGLENEESHVMLLVE